MSKFICERFTACLTAQLSPTRPRRRSRRGRVGEREFLVGKLCSQEPNDPLGKPAGFVKSHS
jgi:hypothetical protein